LSDSKTSLATISAQRKMEPARLTRLVRGELDWIVMRALEKDRVRRYDTASALARDIQRYLGGDPVEAGPPSATYRLRKFARKYRPWLVTAAAFTALLVLATAVSVWQALRATRAERLAQIERNRALDAEKVAKEQTERALKAEQIARAELDKVANQVRRITDATVYLKNKVAGKTVASGTGFVIEVMGDSVLLATSRDVAVLDLSELPTHLVPAGSTPEIEAVFLSGQGPQNEQALPAQTVAVDTSNDRSAELAFLVVKHVKRPPTPINMLNRLEPTEGMAYLGAGFPSGSTQNTVMDRQGNPSVTITRGGIAAVLRDDQGQLISVQMDDAPTPGDSGGPIVEERTGTLIGVGVSQLRGTGNSSGVAVAKRGSAQPIAVLIPADEVRRSLAGRVGAVDLTLRSIRQGAAELEIKAQLVDPKGMVNAVMVHVAPAAAGSIVPYSDGSWPPLRDTKEVELRHDPSTASASGRIQVALSGQGAAARKVLVQTSHRYQSGQLVYSKPTAYDLPDSPRRIHPPGTPLKLILKAARRASFALLEPLIDPDKDCRLFKDAENNRIKIEIPGDKLHTLAPELVAQLDKKKPLHNAPMTLTAVQGDFAAFVEVVGEISPGLALPEDRQGNHIASTFQGAGLLLYQDRDNFVRLERTSGVAAGSMHLIDKVLFEVIKGGKRVESQTYPLPPEGPAYLLLMRRKGRVAWGTSHDRAALPVPIKGINLDFPAKVKIGLSATNISADAFTATFENFVLLNDVTIIVGKFGDTTKVSGRSEGFEAGHFLLHARTPAQATFPPLRRGDRGGGPGATN